MFYLNVLSDSILQGRPLEFENDLVEGAAKSAIASHNEIWLGIVSSPIGNYNFAQARTGT